MASYGRQVRDTHPGQGLAPEPPRLRMFSSPARRSREFRQSAIPIYRRRFPRRFVPDQGSPTSSTAGAMPGRSHRRARTLSARDLDRPRNEKPPAQAEVFLPTQPKGTVRRRCIMGPYGRRSMDRRPNYRRSWAVCRREPARRRASQIPAPANKGQRLVDGLGHLLGVIAAMGTAANSYNEMRRLR